MNAYPTTATYSSPSQPPRMSPWNWVMLIVGVILTAVGLGLLIGGAILLGTNAAQRDGTYLITDSERYLSTGHAIVGPPLVVDTGLAGLPPLEDIASFTVRVSPVIPDQPIFVGVGDASDIATYLDDVPHATLGGMSWSQDGQLTGQWSWPSNGDNNLQEIAGAETPEPPTEQDFWAESATGTGTQEITFDLQEGDWSLVVMSEDGTRPVWVDLQAGARTELFGAVGSSVLIVGAIGVVVGIPLLLLGAAGLGRNIGTSTTQHSSASATSPVPRTASGGSFGTYPLSFAGHLDTKLSRWLWLVKWLLAIPHFVILGLLWFALLITTIAAGLTILFAGRYPRSLFNFSVGVLRWNWRVGFYTYWALGTDRYPPFTLATADYPAELSVPYPERLSRGLVLVKWWLLAIPHLLIVGILTGTYSTSAIVDTNQGWTQVTTGSAPSLIGLIVLIVAIALLFTGRYLPGLFPLVIGLNRWVYRVSTYVLLLRDEYPPFRLDQGPVDPPAPELDGPEPGAGTAAPEPPSTTR